MNIPIVYEDDGLLVVEKPSGMLTVPTPKNEQRTLTSILGLYPCHRLDRNTSGLIIYAKTKALQQKMADEFRQRKVNKVYVAFINGLPLKGEGIIENKIEGMFAKTQYRVVERRNGFAVVQVRPFTGRTNQIRIHFKSIGHPILGEDKFAFRKDFKIKAKRLMLHASRLEFKHPLSEKIMVIDSEIPQAMKDFLKEHAD
ncbi:MAG: RluA family pseudouridine synthase [Candidatus Omnitrophica bacterium]|nr:RluA family pseudouridine synthase [Candidatus Omnitrophota bacterium]MDD3987857.1 RluA family pseudouridine synthase [Candidatus Omnitrophota bacterium]